MKSPHVKEPLLSPECRIYAEAILSSIPRLLANQDRDSTSPTFGCFDREYWAWATKEFSNIDLQRGVYPLAFVWSTRFTGNVYYQNPKILSWIMAGLSYWCQAQHADGSFDHLYPNEHSHVGVAFPLFDVAKTFTLISSALDSLFRERLIACMKKAGRFLILHDEEHGFISNHQAGTACALQQLYLITRDGSYAKKATLLIKGIKDMQSPEGWLFEYSGADPGYQTLDTHYLAQYVVMTKDAAVKEMLASSISFLSHFVHPDRTIGGEYGSRMTELYFPAGFEIMSSTDLTARAIAAFMRPSIQDRRCVEVQSMDIRNFVPFLTSYCTALAVLLHPGLLHPGSPDYRVLDPGLLDPRVLDHGMLHHGVQDQEAQAYGIRDHKDIPSQKKNGFQLKEPPTRLPFQRPGQTYFPLAGFFLHSTKNAYIVISVDKGALRVYRNQQLVFSHCGYGGTLRNGKTVSTLMKGSAKEISVSAQHIKSTLHFFKVPNRVMTQTRFALFRLFNMTLGRWNVLNNLVRRHIIVRLFIAPTPKPLLALKRTITLSFDRLHIKDELHSNGFRFRSLKAQEKCTTIFMASARYYQPSELSTALHSRDFSAELHEKGKATVEFDVSLA